MPEKNQQPALPVPVSVPVPRLKFADWLAMRLRKTPVRKIRAAQSKCAAAGIAITVQDLETHFLCGKDPALLADALVSAKALGVETTFQEMSTVCLIGQDPALLTDALVAAKKLGVETTFREMSSVCLTGQDPMKTLLEASKQRVAKFDTFSPTRNDPLTGFTRDLRQVFATITITYTLTPLQAALGYNLRHIHERLAAAASVFINTTPDMRTLHLQKTSHEAELKLIALELLAGLKSLTIEYR